MSLDYWYDDGYGYYSDMSVGGLFDSLLGGFGSLFDGLFYDDYYYDYGYGYGDYDYGYGYDDYGYDDVLSVDGLDSLGGGLDLSVDGLLGGLLGGLSGLLYDDYYGYDYYGYGYDDYDYGYSYDDSSYDDVLSVDGLDSLGGLLDGTGLDVSGLLDGTGLDLSVDGTSGLLDLLGGLLGGDLSGLLVGDSYDYSSDGDESGSGDSGDLASGLGDLSSILGLLGGSDTSLSADGLDLSSLSSILGLLGGSGTTVSTDGTASGSSLDLSSILGLLGGSGTTVSTDGTASGSSLDLSSILGLLGGSGSSSGLLSGLASLYGGIANIGNGDATWDDLDFLDNLTNVLPSSGDTTDTTSALSSILGLLGGSGTTSTSGLDLSSILALLGNSGTTVSTDAAATDDSQTISVGAATSTTGSSLDLSSILGLFGGSDTSLSADDNSPLLSMLTGLLGELGITINEDGSLISSIIDTALGLAEDTLTVTVDLLNMTALEIPQASSVLSWSSDVMSDIQGFVVEIARGDVFDSAIRMFTTGAAFDVDGSSGIFSCRAAQEDGAFAEEAIEWEAKSAAAPRQIVSNANGQADIFFASPAAGDVWSAYYYARNEITGEITLVAGKNRIRDTFSGSESDANILYLTDDANGDALFMDDVYSEFGSDARLNLIREIRSGAGADVVDMTSARYTAELAGMTVRSGSGDDVLWGAAGGNRLFGDEGDDRITGGAGDDLIAGGSGNDVLNGGGGSDLFTFGENWGDDVVSQLAGGSIELWFAEDESKISAAELDGSVIFLNEAGTASVTVANASLADLTVHFGDDGSARFSELADAGAFLGSTAEAVFETQDARSQGILASL